MRFSYAESLTDPTFYIPLAKAAEAAGYDSMTIADSLAYPFESDSKYPYTPDGNREFLDGKKSSKPLSCSGIGRGDNDVAVNFFVLKLPVRPPALVAKQLGSLAVMTGNRVDSASAPAHGPRTIELMGIPFAKRGKRIDECIEIVQGLTTGEYFEFHGEFYDIAKTKMSPAPTQPIPVLIGGHTPMQRYGARRGMTAGCTAAAHSPEELDRLIAQAQRVSRGRGQDRPISDSRDLDRRLHRRRDHATRGQGRHRRDRRLPVSLYQGARPRAVGQEDPPTGKVRATR